MSNEMSEAGEHVRQHVRKILAQLRALKEQQREDPSPLGPGIAVEIDREEDPPTSADGGESPPWPVLNVLRSEFLNDRGRLNPHFLRIRHLDALDIEEDLAGVFQMKVDANDCLLDVG